MDIEIQSASELSDKITGVSNLVCRRVVISRNCSYGELF
jgi:hypothetical protein